MCLGVPGRVESIEGDGMERIGLVDFAGMRRRVHLAYVPEADVGDHVIVHVGFAISIIDEEQARRVFADLERIGAWAQEKEEIDGLRG